MTNISKLIQTLIQIDDYESNQLKNETEFDENLFQNLIQIPAQEKYFDII
jgi:hypothetical protein